MKLKILIIILLSFVFLQISKAQKIKFKLPERLNVGSFEFSPDGKYALIGGSGLWDINLKRKIVSYDLDNPIFSPDGKYVLGVNGTKLQLLSLSGKLIKEFKGHKDIIFSVAYSPNGKYALSSSMDNTIRLWSIETGKEIQKFNYSGSFYGTADWINKVAFSPNSEYVFLSSVFSTLKLYSTSTGREIWSRKAGKSKYERFSNPIFTPNGKYILAGYYSMITTYNEVNSAYESILIDVNTGKTVKTYNIAMPYYNFAITPNGENVIGAIFYDKKKGDERFGNLTLWNLETGSIIKEFPNTKKKEVAISPDGKYAMIGGTKPASIQIWDIEKLTKIKDIKGSANSFDVITTNTNVFLTDKIWGLNLLFSSDNMNIRTLDFKQGKIKEKEILSGVLLMKDKVIKIDKKGLVSISDLKTNKIIKQYELYENAFLTFSPDYKIFVSTEFSIKYKTFRVKTGSIAYIYETLSGKLIDKFKKDNYTSIDGFSPDGKYLVLLEIPKSTTEKEVTYKIWDIYKKKRIFTTKIVPGKYNISNALVFTADPNTLLILKDKEAILINKKKNKEIKKLQELQGLDITNKSFSADGSYCIINTYQNKSFLYSTDTWSFVREFSSLYSASFSKDSKYIFYDNNKNVIIWNIAASKVKKRLKNFSVNKISYSIDNKYIFITNGTGAFKLLDANTYNEIITFFSVGEKDWVVTTPDGRFDASQGGMKELYFVKGVEIIPLENLMEGFYTPKLWEFALSGEKLKPLEIKIDNIKFPPLVKIISPNKQGDLRGVQPFGTNSLKSTKKEIQVTIKATDQGGGIDEIRLYLNGKLVETTQRGFIKTEQNKNEQTKTFTISLANGKNIIRTTAFSMQRVESNPDEITVFYDGIKKTANLHIFVVGVDNYKNTKYKLNYALADATAFKNEIEKGSNSIFGTVNITFIKDAEVTRTRILQEFSKFKTNTKQEDVFIFYYAGHGVMSEEKKPQFHIIPYDVTQLYGRNDLLKSKAISANELQLFSTELKAQKQMFIFDACQSGGMTELLASRGAAEEKAISQLARSTGTYWLTASGSEQFATEFKELGHGLFTYCVLLGLQGQADGGKKDRKVTVQELSSFLNDKVPILSKKYKGTVQYPSLYGYGMDFPIIIVK